MQVRPDMAAGRLVVAGRTFYFCSLECVRAFASRPEQYAPA
jgi:YHS domain-containing protein